MIAFASNSLLCRAALKESRIDPATFTFFRISSGAVALWLIMSVYGKLSVDKTASPSVDTFSSSSFVARYLSLRHGNWISAAALFAYAAGFSFAYESLSAGTGALLLFGAVQATMVLWGLHKGERLNTIQIAGFIIAVTGFVVLVFPGLSAPPLVGSMLMLGAGIAWGVYFGARQRRTESSRRHDGEFCPRRTVRGCSQHHFRPMDACLSWWSYLRFNIGRGHIWFWLRSLV